MILYWIITTIYTSNSFSSIFIRILPEYFPIPLFDLKRSFHSKNQNLLKKSLSSILFVYWCRPSIFRSNTPFWRSNTALDGPLINQSNRLFLSGYTIKIYIDRNNARKVIASEKVDRVNQPQCHAEAAQQEFILSTSKLKMYTYELYTLS